MSHSINSNALSAEDKLIFSATKPYAREDRLKSWLQLWIIVAAVFFAYFILYLNIDLYITAVVSIILSFLILRFFVIYHDYVHKTILQNSVIARIIFTLFGYYILAPMSIWNRSHNHHHQNNSKLNTTGIGSYPILTKAKYLDLTPADRSAYLFARHPMTILFGYIFTFIIGMCLQSLRNNFKKHWDSLLALALHAGAGFVIFWFGGIGLFFFVFLIPALVTSCLGAYLFYAQHNYPNAAYHQKGDWSYYKAALRSSSYMKMNRMMEWFTGNIGYHHIHHLNPAIPFYNLKKVFNEIREVRKEADTSLTAPAIWACLKLKMWDTSTGKMISLKEV